MMKVVLLCHYWSDEVSDMLGYAPYREIAPWIQETLNLFKNRNDIELHVIAPNYVANKDTYLCKDGIHYHFYTYFNQTIPTCLLMLFSFKIKYESICFALNALSGYLYPRVRIKKIIKKINPDLIHLYGSENPIYATGVFGLFKRYPILLTTQGYAYLQIKPANLIGKMYHSHRVRMERKINIQVKYLANLIRSAHFKTFENNQTFFYLYPSTKVPAIQADATEKEYDIVFYARVCKEKGIEDLIAAIGLLNKKNIRLKTLVIGASSVEYTAALKEHSKNLGIEDLIKYTGFIHEHEEVYKLAARARLLVLPSHNDGFNNTIREAMFMKLPVLANNVGSIPIANQNQECITLAKLGDIEDLADKIMLLLNDSERTERLLNNAYNEMNTRYSPDGIYNMLLDIYKQVHTLHNTPC